MSDATRAVAATAGWGLRTYRGTAALLAIGGAVAVAVALPAIALGGGWAPALHLGGPVEAAVGPGGVFARSPEWLRAEAVRLLCAALFGVSAATFAVGGLGLLLVWAARGGERAGELAIRRAVGASRRVLLAAWLGEGIAVAVGVLAVGLPSGLLLIGWAEATWPGRVSVDIATPMMLLAAATALMIVGGAALGFIFAPRRRLSEGEASPLGLTIGRRLLLGDDPRTWYTVVGVVDVPPPAGLGGALLPVFTVYASVLQHPPRAIELLLRARGRASADPVAPIVHSLGLDPRRVDRITAAALLAAERAPVAWFGRWFALDGWASLLLALAGTVVQMTLWVRSLEPELGLRRALGASRARIIALVLSQAVLVGALGVAIGLCFGPAVRSALGTLVRGLPAWDGGVVLQYAAVLVSTIMLAAVWPAWRASRRNPARLLARG